MKNAVMSIFKWTNDHLDFSSDKDDSYEGQAKEPISLRIIESKIWLLKWSVIESKIWLLKWSVIERSSC